VAPILDKDKINHDVISTHQTSKHTYINTETPPPTLNHTDTHLSMARIDPGVGEQNLDIIIS